MSRFILVSVKMGHALASWPKYICVCDDGESPYTLCSVQNRRTLLTVQYFSSLREKNCSHRAHLLVLACVTRTLRAQAMFRTLALICN